jgi:hypothetical protein
MTLRLDKIFFNHSDTARTGAITIRQNETESVPLPEWQFTGAAPEDPAPVAYRCDKVPSKIIIKASFHRDDDDRNDLEIQAVATAEDDLGNVGKRTVAFNANGDSDLLPFEVSGDRIRARGVDLTTTEWTWQYRASENDQFIDFDRSSHRVYSIFGEPTAPWDGELPWTEVLEYACAWARGAHDTVNAATAITEQVNALGPATVSYIRSPTYAQDKFNCTDFIKLLNRSATTPQGINCDDCATIVSTFANILGCELWQSGMGYFFHTNFIKTIGSSAFEMTGFPRHAVAWEYPCEERQPLYDACFQVDADGQPDNVQTVRAVLPANLVFGSGAARENQYKFCLFREAGDDACDPQPGGERMRRQIGKSFLGRRRFTDKRLLDLFKTAYAFDSWTRAKLVEEAGAPVSEKAKDWSLDDLFSRSALFTEWRISSLETFTDKELSQVGTVLLFRPENDVRELLQINVFESRTAESANEFLLQLLAQFHRTDLERQVENQLGEISFVEPQETAVVFRRHKFSSVVRSVGNRPVSTLEFARIVDEYFKELSKPPI